MLKEHRFYKPMDITEIRKAIIASICSDDELLDLLVLKGGNALSLVHGIGERASIDIDFSISNDFKDAEKIGVCLFKSLATRLNKVGLKIFDTTFSPKPSSDPQDPTWGGYRGEFKLISKDVAAEFDDDTEQLRKRSLSIGNESGQRVFKIEISKHEFTEGKEQAEIDDVTCHVYSLSMIAAEKLRAICQQMEEYEHIKYPSARARDFYDIFSIVNERALDFSQDEFHELVQHVFAAKSVPIHFIGQISDYFDFHKPDFEDVRGTIVGKVESFEFYFNYVVKHAEKLKPLWVK